MPHRYTSFDVAKKEFGNKWSVVLCTNIERQEELILESCDMLIYSGLMKGLTVESIRCILKDISKKGLKSFDKILATEKSDKENIKSKPKKNLEKYFERV